MILNVFFDPKRIFLGSMKHAEAMCFSPSVSAFQPDSLLVVHLPMPVACRVLFMVIVLTYL